MPHGKSLADIEDFKQLTRVLRRYVFVTRNLLTSVEEMVKISVLVPKHKISSGRYIDPTKPICLVFTR